jgi:hypothetical protein
MVDVNSWDWETGEKTVSLSEWEGRFKWIEEPYASPDGERVAAVVNIEEGEFNVCVNGDTWENTFDKIWHLRFSPDGRLTALVSEMGEWTVAVDGTPWEGRFGYVWNPLFSRDGAHMAVAVQQDMKYCMALDGNLWDTSYVNMTYFAMSPDGTKTAAAVQTRSVDSGEVHKFQEGAFTAAMDGRAWDTTFVNVWHLAIGPDGETLAAEVRVNLYEYTIAVNGKAWEKTYGGVWEPVFHPQKQTVLAPVRLAGKWTLAGRGRTDLGPAVCPVVARYVQCGRVQGGGYRRAQVRPVDRCRRWNPMVGDIQRSGNRGRFQSGRRKNRCSGQDG